MTTWWIAERWLPDSGTWHQWGYPYASEKSALAMCATVGGARLRVVRVTQIRFVVREYGDEKNRG